MYSCRCCALHNCRVTCGTLCMAHSVDTLYSYVQQPWGIGSSWNGNWEAQIPKKVQRPQLQVRGFPSRARPLAGFTSLFVSTFSLCPLIILAPSFRHPDLEHSFVLLHGSLAPLLPLSSVNLMPFGSCHQPPSPLPFPIQIPQRDNRFGLSFPIWVESSCLASSLVASSQWLGHEAGLCPLFNHLPP